MCGRATLSRQVTVMASRRQQEAARQREVRQRKIEMQSLVIDAVRARPAVWNMKSSDYRDIFKRAACWAEIAEEVSNGYQFGG